jgi:hypothetical protein
VTTRRRSWRLLGGMAVPPLRRAWRRGWGGVDEAAIGGGTGDPGGGMDIAADLGPFEDASDAAARDRPATGDASPRPPG